MAVKHSTVATLPDEVGAEVNKNEWNADHTIDNGTITNDHLAGSIANTKLLTDPLARANHTGTQTASTISDYNSAVATFTNKTIDVEDATNIIKQTTPAVGEYLRDNGTKFVSSVILTGDIPTAIDATKIADGTVTSSEFQFINTLSSNAQTQIDGKAASGHTHVLTSGATDVTMTSTNLNTLDDGVDSTLHFHAADRSRANHTGTQLTSTISDIDTSTVVFSNKTVNATNNTITDTSHATGDLLKGGASKYVRFPRGSALQQLRVNAGGTDLEWATISGGGSPLTTKGDLFTYTTVDARLPVGTDGFVLKANSGTATGLEWQSASAGGGLPHPEVMFRQVFGF